jgi:YHS domain-containing protein
MKPLALLTGILLLALASCTQSTGPSAMDAMTPIDLHNTKCAVTGDDVGSSKLTAIYQGKIYHFCCDDCPTAFKKDPAKYAAEVAANPAKYGVKPGA